MKPIPRIRFSRTRKLDHAVRPCLLTHPDPSSSPGSANPDRLSETKRLRSVLARGSRLYGLYLSTYRFDENGAVEDPNPLLVLARKNVASTSPTPSALPASSTPRTCRRKPALSRSTVSVGHKAMRLLLDDPCHGQRSPT